MYCDSKEAIAILCYLVQHSYTKHINVRYHFIKEHVEKGIVELFFIGTEYQLADLFTKALPKDRFKYLVRRLGMRCLTLEELEVKMDDPNITMEEYIRLEEEKARKHVIDYNDAFTSEVTLSCKPTISPLNDNKIDFRISFDESNDEDYT
ncbi:hypothetical protein Tco_0943921, partial [Tanacetum coccineum]